MAYKLIAIDLDDTLLNPRKEISDEDRRAIERARLAGVHIVLASGRCLRGVEGIHKSLSLDGYTISAGGAVVTDPLGKQIYSCGIPAGTAAQIVQYAIQNGYYFQYYYNNSFYYIKRARQTAQYEQACKYSGTEDPGLLDWKDVSPSKILIIEDPKIVQAARPEVDRLFPEVKTAYSQPDYLEMHYCSVSKGNALQFLAGLLKLEPSEIIAIGDSEIDLSMLRYAGMGVAVANAGQAVLQAADYVTASCEESGVARAINKFVFGE